MLQLGTAVKLHSGESGKILHVRDGIASILLSNGQIIIQEVTSLDEIIANVLLTRRQVNALEDAIKLFEQDSVKDIACYEKAELLKEIIDQVKRGVT
jgi:hypothetical protein